MLVEPLRISTPNAAYNGGLYVRPDISAHSGLSIAMGNAGPERATHGTLGHGVE